MFDGASFRDELARRGRGATLGMARTVALVTLEEGMACCDRSRGTLQPEAQVPCVRGAQDGGARLCDQKRFPGVLLGLSGGIDSALTLAVAADALGRERVHAVMMPSQYTRS